MADRPASTVSTSDNFGTAPNTPAAASSPLEPSTVEADPAPAALDATGPLDSSDPPSTAVDAPQANPEPVSSQPVIDEDVAASSPLEPSTVEADPAPAVLDAPGPLGLSDPSPTAAGEPQATPESVSSQPVTDEDVAASRSSYPSATHTPLPQNDALEPPRASYLTPEFPSPRDSYGPSSANNSEALLGPSEKAQATDTSIGDAQSKRRPFFQRPLVLLALFAGLVVVVLAVILPVYFVVIKPHNRSSSTSAAAGPGGGSGSGNPASPTGATSGGNGTVIVTDDGSQFTYINQFGGYWVYDPNDPFNNNACPNSWTPPLNTSWTWGTDRVFGVNLGGLFVLEPFIAPSLFQKYPTAVDEWTLSAAMTADTSSGGGLGQIEDHYNTFITEQDIAEIAGAGLNWIRLPIPYWCIDTWPGEPFLARTSWKYILRVIGWARKYGLRVNIDLHTIPGSQNGYNHSGRLGPVNFLNGVMGIANAERTLNYIRILTEFFAQPEYENVVAMFGIVNEALVATIGQSQITSFYLQAHDMIREITGLGAGHGPYISIHDGFLGTGAWANFLPGSDRIILDTHPYFAFDGAPNDAPIVTDEGDGKGAGGTWPQAACSWGPGINTSQTAFGVTVAGEFSNGFNDCGLYVEGVGGTSSNPDCSLWTDASQWNATVKNGLMDFALASMDALQNWFFWTWKVGNSSTSNTVESPLWSYQLGLQQGWMPTDPRTAVGKCGSLGVTGPQFNGQYQSWQTGGAGAGTFAPSVTEPFPYPPTSISNAAGAATLLPSYASTGSIETLPPPTLTATTKSVSEGDGWYDTADTGGAPTPVAGCTYPNAWSAVGIAVPTPCGTAAGVGAGVVTAAPARRGRYMA